MYKDEPISYLQLLFLIMMSTGFYNHVIIAPPILDMAKRDAWVSSLLTFIPFLIVVSIIYIVHRITKDQPLLLYIQDRLGNTAKLLFSIPILAYLLISGYITYFDTLVWTKVSYLPKTPMIVLAVTTIFVILLFLKQGMQTLAISSGILLPFVFIFGIFVTTANFQNKDYSLLFPILADGWGPVWKGLLIGSSGAVDLVIILFIQHQVKKRMSFWKYGIIAAMLLNLLISPVSGAIAIFGAEYSVALRYPSYEQWRMVTVGAYITHVDYFTIYQWLSGALIRIALIVYLLPYMFPLKKEKSQRNIRLIYTLGLLVSLYLPFSDMQFYNSLRDYMLPWIVYGMGLYLVILLGTVLLVHRRQSS